MLGSDEALALLRRYHLHGDTSAREKLIVESLPYVRRLAARFRGRGIPVDDLVQIGMVGAIKAVDRFDVTRGTAFVTYLTPLVLGEIKRHFRDRAWAIRVSRPVQELALELPKASERLQRDLGRSPTIAELAEALGSTDEQVVEALDASHAYSAASLSSPVAGEDAELEGTIGAVDEGYELSEMRALLRQAIGCLDERERRVLLLRFAAGLTQSEVATRIHCSQMHVSRIERGALAKLRETEPLVEAA